MTRLRLTLLLAGTAGALALIAVAVLASSTFQTWAAQRALASRPDWSVTVGSVAAGWRNVTLQDVRWRRGAVVLSAPKVELDLSVWSAGMRDQVSVTRLVASDWILDLSAAGTTPPVASPAAIPAGASAVMGATLQAFAGALSELQLPAALELSGVALDGMVLLPGDAGRARFNLTGGGLSAGKAGEFRVRADAVMQEPALHALSAEGTLRATMDTPRSFAQLEATLEAVARGPRWPEGLRLTSEVAARRRPDGEQYTATLATPERPLLMVSAEFPHATRRFSGAWKLDMADGDLVPFALGHALPVFVLSGDGRFEADGAFAEVSAAGRLTAALDRLEVVAPKLRAVGASQLSADFDLARKGDWVTVRQLTATLSAPAPVATLRALQSFNFNPLTREFEAEDAMRELFSLRADGLPLRWLRPLATPVDIVAGQLQGEVVATATAGGIALRTRAPLDVADLALAARGRPAWPDVEVSATVEADYTPRGWQVALAGVSVRGGPQELLLFDARAGRLAGAVEPLKSAGKLSVNLAALGKHVGAGAYDALRQGEASIEFVASVDHTTELQARVDLRKLGIMTGAGVEALPEITADLRADLTADGTVAWELPIVLNRAARISDLNVAGRLGPEHAGIRRIEGNVTSANLVVEDTALLAALATGAGAYAPADGWREAAPWARFPGRFGLQVQRLVISDTLELAAAEGSLSVDRHAIRLEGGQARLEGATPLTLSGALAFDGTAPSPFTLQVEAMLREFDPAPLLRKSRVEQPAMVEGRFEVAARLQSAAPALEKLGEGVTGDLQMTSKGGVFRGLPVDAKNLAETSRIAAFIASAGAALGALTGRREYLDVASKAEAVGELSNGLSAIVYDQLNLLLSRDASGQTTVREFALIAPELRLTGAGHATHPPGAAFGDGSLVLDFILKARGRNGELLRYLGVLETQTDDLGYAACSVPVRIRGTLAAPDASEFSEQITALTLEKSGLGDRAVEFLRSLRGGGK